MDQNKPKSYLFETETCSRCGGAGNYSYCSYYGTRCFKCHGAKVVLTKRGAIAQRYLEELQTVSIKDLAVGAIIRVHSITHGGQGFSYKAAVTHIGPSDSVAHVGSTVNGVTQSETLQYICIKTTHPKFGDHSLHTFQNGTVRTYPNTAENIAKALEYQASLTKAGTVRKAKKATAASK